MGTVYSTISQPDAKKGEIDLCYFCKRDIVGGYTLSQYEGNCECIDVGMGGIVKASPKDGIITVLFDDRNKEEVVDMPAFYLSLDNHDGSEDKLLHGDDAETPAPPTAPATAPAVGASLRSPAPEKGGDKTPAPLPSQKTTPAAVTFVDAKPGATKKRAKPQIPLSCRGQ